MIIPLGLGFKFLRFPYVTTLLCLISIFVFFKNPEKPKQISKEIKSIFIKERFGTAQAKLFQEYCLNEGGDNQVCSDIGKEIEEAYTPLAGRSQRRKIANDADDNDDEGQLKENQSIQELLRQQVYYTKMVKSFRFKMDHPDDAFESLSGYARFNESYESVRDDLSQFYRIEHLLSKNSISLLSVLESQFSHGSFAHLMGNILFLFLFGAYVEQRLNPLIYVATYLLGGSLGLISQALLYPDPVQYVVGASANVSAVMGLFFVFFFRFRMKFFMWYFTGKSFLAPVSITFPIFYILQEVVSAIEGMDGASNIAHLAHLGGVGLGIYVAFMLDSFKPVPWPFLYDQEQADFEKLKKQNSLIEKLKQGRRILAYNQQNSIVRDYLLKEILIKAQEGPVLEAKLEIFLRKEINLAAEEKLRTADLDSLVRLLAQCPAHHPLTKLLTDQTAIELLRIGDHALKQKYLFLAVRLYDLFMISFPDSAQVPAVKLTLAEVYRNLPQNQSTDSYIETYLRFHPKSFLRMIRVPGDAVLQSSLGGLYGPTPVKAS